MCLNTAETHFTSHITYSSIIVCYAWTISRKHVFATVSFHNCKSQKIKLSVSSPKNEYVAYLSLLSQISNRQGLGRKNKHEI